MNCFKGHKIRVTLRLKIVLNLNAGDLNAVYRMAEMDMINRKVHVVDSFNLILF